MVVRFDLSFLSFLILRPARKGKVDTKRHRVKSSTFPDRRAPVFHPLLTVSISCLYIFGFIHANIGQYDCLVFFFFFGLFFMQKVGNYLKELFNEKLVMSSRVHIPAPVEAFPFPQVPAAWALRLRPPGPPGGHETATAPREQGALH